MAEKCQFLVRPLKRLIDDYSLPLQLNSVASMFQVFFTDTPVFDYETVRTSDNAKFMDYHANLLRNGVFVPPSQFETCFLSSAHSTGDLKNTISVWSEVLG